jgi:hypothetical protein
MGMYTEFHFNVELKEDTPKKVINILKKMVKDNDIVIHNLPEHDFFKTSRWEWMLCSDSYYFDADTHSTIREDASNTHYLCVRCNLKNYDNEIELFLNWINKYLAYYGGEFLGFYRYEEDDIPTLINYKQES